MITITAFKNYQSDISLIIERDSQLERVLTKATLITNKLKDSDFFIELGFTGINFSFRENNMLLNTMSHIVYLDKNDEVVFKGYEKNSLALVVGSIGLTDLIKLINKNK